MRRKEREGCGYRGGGKGWARGGGGCEASVAA